MSVNIGERVRSLRTARGLSQEEVARRTGIGLKSYGDLERGRTRDPHYSTLRGVARALEVRVEDLLEEPVPLADAPSSSGPPRVSKEKLAAQGITATDAEVDEVNYTIADFWRLIRGGQPVAYVRDDDVNIRRVGMLVDLVLDTPSIVTPEAAGVVRQGMREKLKTG
jgi:transcriptional regulator with XRE-family HTH domain